MKDKTYKTINEVSKLLNLNTHIIRYWDSKLSISSQSNSKKKKFYNNRDIHLLKELKDTLYQNGKYNYSLALANKIINKSNRRSSNNKNISPIIDKENIVNRLQKINNNLKKVLNSLN